MDVELIEIREFLVAHPPFDRLPDDLIDSLTRQLRVRYLRRGSPFPPAQDDGPAAALVRTGAVEFRSDNGKLLEKLGEGELYAEPCPDAGSALPESGTCSEDTLLYLLPCDALQTLREQHSEFNSHFEQSVRQRLQHALAQLQQGQGSVSNLMQLEAGSLVRRAPIGIGPQQSIREAASVMSDKRVSSLLVMEGEKLLGIVTDRDLRQRVIAAGLDTAEPVARIMTADLFTLNEHRAAFDALMAMTQRQIHHLPITTNDGTLRGIITASDLLHQHSLNTVSLAGTIRRCKSVEELEAASRELPELQLQLISSGMAAEHLTQALSTVADTLAQRLLELAEEKLGSPPVPYAWLVCGSQARHEQTTVSDQDNALLIDDAMQPEHDAWFTELARFVSDGLARCGYSYCPGEVMATNPKWRQTLGGWRGYFDDWIKNPAPMALMHSSIFFDMRPLHGDTALFDTLHEQVLERCRDNTIFLAYMTANALKHRPPLGFFRQFVLVHDGEHDDTLDLKHRGIIPVVDMARVFALSAGLPQLNTRERLQAAEQAGALSHDGAEDLQHALEFIATLRARHQAEQHLAGEPMDNYIRPDALSRLERAQLKDAFATLRNMQEALEQRYQSSRLA
ncbi:MAG: putative nucleotidyltransferase substrate binding domain-containing protein [Pseudomonadota bacterium]